MGFETQRRHPALEIDTKRVTLTRVSARGDVQIVTSDRELCSADDAKEWLRFVPRSFDDLAGRWDEDDVLGFVTGEPAPTFTDVLTLTMGALESAMEFPRPEHRALVATWAVASYFFPLFLTFPRLSLSGERESGKSKVLSLLRATAWNALLMLNPTPAVLYRLIQEFRATLLLDEVEGLAKDDLRDVLAIINSGYKAGATVPRCEGKDQKRRVESFAVYAPLALAAIRSPNATTEDRCIPVVLQRGRDRQKLNAEIDVNAQIFTRIRAGCHRLLLTRWEDVREAHAIVRVPEWLNGRARELWKPLLAMAELGDLNADLGLLDSLLSLARDHVADRPGASAEAEALLAVLADLLEGADTVTVRPGELREPLRVHLGWRDAPRAEIVGSWLRRLGFPRVGKDREGAKYEVAANRFREVMERHTPATTVTPSPSHGN